MKAEIISIGTELLLGQVTNTNAFYVAWTLSELGIGMMFSCTVGDNNGHLKEALIHTLRRNDLVITAGSLSPIEDDLTKEAIAECTGAPLVAHEESMRYLKEYFSGRYIGQNQAKQAILSEGPTVLLSDHSTAPGRAVETKEGKIIMIFSGPLSELISMLHSYGISFSMKRENTSIFSMNMHVFDQGEGVVTGILSGMTDALDPMIATYAEEGEMYIRVTAKAKNTQEVKEMCRPVVERIRGRIGNYMYGINVDSLGQLAVNLLSGKKVTAATAGSCSGGFLAKRTTDIPGSSQVFEMEVVTYANWIRTLLFDMPEELLEKYGAVSEEVAAAMTESVRKRSDSDIGVGITGVAGPDDGTEEEPIGLIYVGFSDKDGTVACKVKVFSHRRPRSYHKYTVASLVLDTVRRHLEGFPL